MAMGDSPIFGLLLSLYTGTKMGEVVNRTPFTVNIYTEEKDGDGETTGYLKFTCKH